MFYCEACRGKNEWLAQLPPEGERPCYGTCKMCGRVTTAGHLVPSEALPESPKRPLPPALPPFDPAAVCPKCRYAPYGHINASSEWKPACGAQRRDEQPQRVNRPERIVRTCRRCGFTWNEAPLDAEGRN